MVDHPHVHRRAHRVHLRIGAEGVNEVTVRPDRRGRVGRRGHAHVPVLRRERVERQRHPDLVRLQDPVPPAGRRQSHRDRPLENARVIPGFGQHQVLHVSADRHAQVHPGCIRIPGIHVLIHVEHPDIHPGGLDVDTRRVPRRVDEFRRGA